eukprot:gb/GECH01008690.1/.p1 GENE.gb/GECH01008690.1/~~gb/GECH01008690.1/.p1  ORF type:complete len:931 (+),score=243.43 gb/GECH01008690.1/:1-2793(+)
MSNTTTPSGPNNETNPVELAATTVELASKAAVTATIQTAVAATAAVQSATTSSPNSSGANEVPDHQRFEKAGMHRNREDLSFPMEEYYTRVCSTRSKMRSMGIDLLIVTEPENLNYLTGFETVGEPPIQALLLPANEPFEFVASNSDNQRYHISPLMVTRKLEKSNIDFRTWLTREQRKSYGDTEEPYAKFIEAIFEKFGPWIEKENRVIGLEQSMRSHRAKVLQFLKTNLPQAQFNDASDILSNLRLIKRPLELIKIEKAAQITYNGMRAMINSVKGISSVREGTPHAITESNIAAAGYKALFESGSTYAGYPIFVSSGPHGALGHATSQTRRLEKGDIVFLELTGIVNRYSAPIMRTLYIGEQMPEWLQDVNDTVLSGVRAEMKTMKPGTPAFEADYASRSRIAECSKRLTEKWGIRVTQYARSAYSCGVNFMVDWGEGELMSISETETRKLETGMVFHLIPWVQLWDAKTRRPIGGIGLSETVIVTPEGGRSVFESYDLPVGIHCVSPPKPALPVESKHDNQVKNESQQQDEAEKHRARACFASDNAGPVHPEVIDAISAANRSEDGEKYSFALAYGNDMYTQQARELIQKEFGPHSDMVTVATGTAANVLCLSLALNMPHEANGIAGTASAGGIICHGLAHLSVDEHGGPERFLGAKLVTINRERNDDNGKISVADVERIMNKYKPDAIVHRVRPRVLSITQPTEMGAVYSTEEVRALASVCQKHNLMFHMDGSRLSNAVAALGHSPAEISTKCGVDVLTWGLTKNGTLDAEMVIVSPRSSAKLNHLQLHMQRLMKQGMQMKSKARYQSAQVVAMLKNDLYVRCARHANEMAQLIAHEIQKLNDEKLELKFQVDTNTLLVRMPESVAKELNASHFLAPIWWDFSEQEDAEDKMVTVRIMASWATEKEKCHELVGCIGNLLRSYKNQ